MKSRSRRTSAVQLERPDSVAIAALRLVGPLRMTLSLSKAQTPVRATGTGSGGAQVRCILRPRQADQGSRVRSSLRKGRESTAGIGAVRAALTSCSTRKAKRRLGWLLETSAVAKSCTRGSAVRKQVQQSRRCRILPIAFSFSVRKQLHGPKSNERALGVKRSVRIRAGLQPPRIAKAVGHVGSRC